MHIRTGVAAVALLAATGTAHAEEDGSAALKELQRRMDEMERRHDEEMRALREQLARAKGKSEGDAEGGGDLADAVEEYLERTRSLENRVETLSRPGPQVKLMDISLNGLFTVGGSTATDSEIADLQGGGHDPRKRGFSVQNVELSFRGAIDPWLEGEAHIITFIDAEGETAVELEEAFLTTTSLPAGLQLKAGQFFTEFGRLNATHPHAWEFVDQPVVNSRMFGGDGMRGPGARLSWLTPAAFPLELIVGAQNANGETMASFVSEEPLSGRPSTEPSVRSATDLTWSSRIAASTDLSDTTTLLAGTSAAWGPNGTGPSARTRILGADLTLKWRPSDARAGFPFVTWTTEVMQRRYAAAEFNEPGSGLGYFPHEVLTDRGFYSQATWGFLRNWTAGIRWDGANGAHDGNALDPARDRRSRVSAALTWFPSEFSRVRLQVNRDRSEALGGAFTSVWLQFEFNLGSHGAHRF